MGADPAVLVTGAGGQVGRALRKRMATGRFLSRETLDVTQGDAVRSALERMDVVVHLAAMTDVDRCERDQELAFAVNRGGTENVVAAAKDNNVRVVYVSTDYVFDGRKEGEYSEEDPPAPINVYGRSKLEGEELVAGAEGSLIVRTSWLFGQGRNFIRRILDAARTHTSLRVVDDQRGRPTWSEDLAGALVHLIRADASGILHVAGDGPPCSWAQLAATALQAVGSTTRIEAVDSESYARLISTVTAPRPKNSTLCLAKARREGVPMGDWRAAVAHYLREGS